MARSNSRTVPNKRKKLAKKLRLLSPWGLRIGLATFVVTGVLFAPILASLSQNNWLQSVGSILGRLILVAGLSFGGYLLGAGMERPKRR